MRATWLYAILAIVCIGITETARANQTTDKAAVTKAAKTAYEAKDWQKAALLYEQLTVEEAGNPRVWYRFATSLHAIGQETKAIAAYQKALDAGLPQALGNYQLGLVYASLKQNEKALEFLQKAVEQGFNQPGQFDVDSELPGLRGDARFSKLVDQARRNQKPCAYSAENRQFDFWLGESNVVTTHGEAPAGTSKIELILGDCVVQENWTSGGNSGYTGKSYNIYNKSLKRWEQYWVDSAGGNIFFYGGLKDGVMDYWTDSIPQANGTKLKRHLQFFKLGPDTVRQFSQGSTDDGKTWHVEYDLTYHRKTQAAN
ncbi:MAG TPA: tetratricopeptide repeat protein [Candidatus Solibacter sp.]|nr:tetratricopeptide repeat protein [Candidatus Solibacter sp.]